ncbi:hypothetical protein D3C85_686530 [compost metagenome]
MIRLILVCATRARALARCVPCRKRNPFNLVASSGTTVGNGHLSPRYSINQGSCSKFVVYMSALILRAAIRSLREPPTNTTRRCFKWFHLRASFVQVVRATRFGAITSTGYTSSVRLRSSSAVKVDGVFPVPMLAHIAQRFTRWM